MRRVRTIREYRDIVIRNTESKAVRHQKLLKRRRKYKQASNAQSEIKKIVTKVSFPLTSVPSHKPFNLPPWKTFDQYDCKLKSKLVVAHFIESLGIGGAQTMMMSLMNALSRYYGDYCKNIIIIPEAKSNFDKTFVMSHGISINDIYAVDRNKIKQLCLSQGVNVVLHHRISLSKCIKDYLPQNVKYVLINHTFHEMDQIDKFIRCDCFVSVCQYLHDKTKWDKCVYPDRCLTILNGIENDYINDIKPAVLEGDFKTGRCHRLVPSKFRLDSLRWMEKKLRTHIPNHKHYLIGSNAHAGSFCKRSKVSRYFGPIYNRDRKMSIIKALDVYFYETFQGEGASIAILESLSCGVPVLCCPYGGNIELVSNGINGFVLPDRASFMLKMKDISSNKKMLSELKLQTKKDFEERLHVRHTACKYMQLFERLSSMS